MARIMVLSLGLVMLSGCALTTAKLDVGLKDSAVAQSPLASLAPLSVQIADVSDKRPDQKRIGFKKNGFGMDMADIQTSKPVPEIVRDALVLQLAKSGHRMVAEQPDVVVKADVKTFWFDITPGLTTVDFAGTVAMDLIVSDAAGTVPLLTRTYQANYMEKSWGGLDGTWERVMNTALQRMMWDVSTDPQLLATLRARGKPVAKQD